MSAQCCADPNCEPTGDPERDRRYRRVLVAALAINASMFVVEIVAGLIAGSVSLQADALDFFADAANYGITLFVLGMALRFRTWAALVKGSTMGVFGLWVLISAAWHAVGGTLPRADIMGSIGIAALVANVTVLGLLWQWRNGDANMRSVWICSRNDVISNCAVLLAAAGVFGTGRGWPDVIVAALMVVLALQGAAVVIRQALSELRGNGVSTLPAH